MILKGKTALVTGSTSGIGLAMAKAMAKQGANVMMNGFGDKEAAIAAVKAYGVAVDYHGADMSKPDEIAQMITATEKRFGKYPDKPTLVEVGINAVAVSPYGLVGPKALPEPRTEAPRKPALRAMSTAAVITSIASGMTPRISTRA